MVPPVFQTVSGTELEFHRSCRVFGKKSSALSPGDTDNGVVEEEVEAFNWKALGSVLLNGKAPSAVLPRNFPLFTFNLN